MWNCDAALFKSLSIKKRAKLRMQFDFFNVFDVPGNPWAANSEGIVNAWQNANTTRVMQMSARLSW